MSKLEQFKGSGVELDWVQWRESSDGVFSIKSLKSLLGTNLSVIWTVWLFRNEVVFNNKEIDLLQILYLVKYRLAIWIKAKFLGGCISLDNLIAEPTLAIKIYSVVVAGGIKSGLDGLLRNDQGAILFQFSKPCGNGPPALIELLAVRFGVLKFFSSNWCRHYRLIVNSDYKSVVDWISLSVNAPLSFSNMVSKLSDMVIKRGFVMRLIPRSCNIEAD
ncbi:hypothetical protein V6N12_070007 [Hibiscus sabdariffa]|uniref:RNase H type-1 domain-containing protein n=1 Tax=Hibiscus sabdariffa TaxID=183260 RepID=A0ABR2FG04_9ROSI